MGRSVLYKRQIAVEDQLFFYQVSTGDVRLVHPPLKETLLELKNKEWVAQNGRDVELPCGQPSVVCCDA
tara:strand:- start:494 stop:700 length:207 start_codon:yes stop_codon:yes gene_type:complete